MRFQHWLAGVSVAGAVGLMATGLSADDKGATRPAAEMKPAPKAVAPAVKAKVEELPVLRKMTLAPAAERLAERLVKVRGNLAEITRAAEAVAQRWVEKKQVLIHSPFGGDCNNLSMEITSRAGGLDNIRTNTVRLKERSGNDVILFGPRSWERGGKYVTQEGAKRKEEGWMIVVFGSRAGMPEGFAADFVIDNFAPNGSEDQAAVNMMVNAASAWIFQCELTSALTRRGFYPGILKGMTLPGSTAHNKKFQLGNAELYPCETKIEAGKLGTQFLDELEKSLKDLQTPACQAQLEKAATLAAERIKSGKTVWMSSFTHILDGEVFFDNYAPTRAFRGISHQGGKTFTKNLQKGDLLFWFGEWTLNMPWTDYLAIIRSTGADYVTSVRVGDEPFEPMGTEAETRQYYDLKTPDALMVLEQRWPMDASVVDIPFEPRKMAPVSGVYLTLMYRMLDEKIAGKL